MFRMQNRRLWWEALSWLLAVVTLALFVYRLAVNNQIDGFIAVICVFMLYQATQLRKERFNSQV